MAWERFSFERGVLQWYQEQSRLCRLIHSEGDEGRNNLAQDGGKRAVEALPDIEAAIGENDASQTFEPDRGRHCYRPENRGEEKENERTIYR